MHPFILVLSLLVESSRHDFKITGVVRQVILRPKVLRLSGISRRSLSLKDRFFLLVVRFILIHLFLLNVLWFLVINWLLLVNWFFLVNRLLNNFWLVKLLQLQRNDFYLFRLRGWHCHFNSGGDGFLIVLVSNDRGFVGLLHWLGDFPTRFFLLSYLLVSLLELEFKLQLPFLEVDSFLLESKLIFPL